MKKIKFKFSLILIILGICIVTISRLVDEVIPKLGFAAYQIAAAGSYNPENYHLDLTLNYRIGGFCIFVGIVYLLINSNSIKNQLGEFTLRNKEFDEKHKND